MSRRPLFLDHHSTTPLDPRVFAAMTPWFLEDFGNPHSTDHAFGWRAEAGVETARRAIAALIGARPAEIIFTSGATESNNLALQGAAAALPVHRRHLITTTFEHPCVAGVFDRLEARGFAITRIRPDADGRIRPAALGNALRRDTGLVSIISAHHEIGTIQPIADLAAVLGDRAIVFHSDAAQAVGKIPVDVGKRVDLLSLSAHKVGGPKGIGALFIRRRAGFDLKPLFAGGGQQRGYRPGTVPTPLAVGLGEACRLSGLEMAETATRVGHLRDLLLAGLAADIPGLRVNGAMADRLPHNLNICIPGIAAVDLIYAIRDHVAISAGSACASAIIEPSHSLKAIGLDDAAAMSSVRIGLGRDTSAADITAARAAIAGAVARMRG